MADNSFHMTAAPPGWFAMFFSGERDDTGEIKPPSFLPVTVWASFVVDSRGDCIEVFGYAADPASGSGMTHDTCDETDGFLCYLPPAYSTQIITETLSAEPMDYARTTIRDLMRQRVIDHENNPLPSPSEDNPRPSSRLARFLGLTDDFVLGIAIGLSLGDND